VIAAGLTLLEEHWQFLRSRAVADDVATERGYQSAMRKADLNKLGFGPSQQLIPALVLPIWSVRRAVESYQLRPDQPRLDKKGKPRKYEMKAGGGMLLDMHPRLTRRSEGGGVPLISDPGVPLFITEGIPKGDAAVSIGLCCLALLGVWNWRGSNTAGGKTALADWDSVALNNRLVYIAFDSDVMQKPEVHKALIRLKAFLEGRGAIVKLIYLPAGGHGEKVGLDDFIARERAAGRSDADIRDAILALATSELRKPASGDSENQVGIYREVPSGLVRVDVSPQGVEREHPLTNFRARIIGDITRDDGAETTRRFEIKLKQGERHVTTTVAVAQFPAMRWPVEALGAEAVLYAGAGTADHTRVAIQLLSKSPVRRTVYAHTGWRKISDDWVYIQAGGAIGAAGEVEGIEVSLPPELAAFQLELPSDVNSAKSAIAASLRLLNVGPDRITIPTFGAIWRAIVGGADFSVFLYGPTGVFKTELSALVEQHFGTGFDARHLPTSFTSTANTNEALAFAAKDAVLVVDELHPPASGSEREAMYRDAARLLRSQGNAAGRGRMRSDGTLRPSRPPRGLMVATGEELPRGQSIHARLFTLEIQAGSVDTDRLTACQADAARGLYAQATAAFVRWLAPHLDEARAEFEALRREARGQFHHDHARTADIRAQLTAAYSIFVAFLVEVEVIDASEVADLQARVGAALQHAANTQVQFSATSEPVGAFVRLLTSAIAAGRAHLADPRGGAPEKCERACGWRKTSVGTAGYQRDGWQPQGDRVGWLDGDYVYLNRDAAYRAAQGMSADGTGIEVSVTTLTRRLRDKHLLASTDRARETLTIRRVLEGKHYDVLHLDAKSLGLSLAPEPDIPDSLIQGKAPPNDRMSG
jgi:hypothetical protein